MVDSVDEFSRFVSKSDWSAPTSDLSEEAYEILEAVAQEHPEQLGKSLLQLLQVHKDSLPRSSRLLAYVKLADFPALIDGSLDLVERDGRAHQFASDVLRAAVVQASSDAMARLGRVMELAKQDKLDYLVVAAYGLDFLNWEASAPLREYVTSGETHAQNLGVEFSLRGIVLGALLGSHDAQVVEFAVAQCQEELGDPSPTYTPFVGGAIYQDGTLFELYDWTPLSLCFPKDQYLEKQFFFEHDKLLHPTWNDGPEAGKVKFGGLSGHNCACGKPLVNVLHFDQIPEGIGVTGVTKLQLVTCLACLSTTPGYFEHDEAGSATLISWPEEPVATGDDVPLEIEGRLVKLDDRWRYLQKDFNENMNRVAGPPSWLQNGDYPECPKCQAAMRFLAQLDSGFPIADDFSKMGGSWDNLGMLYLFWCDACKVSGQFVQCT